MTLERLVFIRESIIRDIGLCFKNKKTQNKANKKIIKETMKSHADYLTQLRKKGGMIFIESFAYMLQAYMRKEKQDIKKLYSYLNFKGIFLPIIITEDKLRKGMRKNLRENNIGG